MQLEYSEYSLNSLNTTLSIFKVKGGDVLICCLLPEVINVMWLPAWNHDRGLTEY